jgi:formamidopyrimidine-DNA glycosylase
VELPEVEVMRRDLEKDVVGLRIKKAEVKSSKNAMRAVRRHKTRKDFTSRLEGRKITKV